MQWLADWHMPTYTYVRMIARKTRCREENSKRETAIAIATTTAAQYKGKMKKHLAALPAATALQAAAFRSDSTRATGQYIAS